jgi:membrane-associated protease RseP (regulator of RpoE activity)
VAVAGVVFFAVALLASIALHELGHLLTAKRFGMYASRYFVGMGPTLWSTWRGETEYGVKALPIGGFVKIVGMTQLEELDDPRDDARAFWRFPAGQRAVVLGAGSFMHFVIAIVLLFATLLIFGEETVDTTRVDKVSPCITDVAGDPCTGKPPSPAKAAGVLDGDRIVEFEGKHVTSWDDFTTAVRAHAAGPSTLVVLRDGTRVTLHPVVVRGVREIAEGVKKEVGQIGVAPGERERYSPFTAVPRTAVLTGSLMKDTVKALVELPGKVPDVFRSTTSKEPRRAEEGGPVGVVDLGRISGQALASGHVDSLLSMIISLNVFIGLFNLLPLLPLDGGHLAILGFESARSRIAKARGRRDPGRVDLRRLMPAMVAFIVVMGSLTVLLLYVSIVNPVQNPF